MVIVSGLRQSKGMTLVEMMIAIGITAIVMTMSVSIFVSQFGSYNRGKNVKESQQSGQEVLGLIKSDLLEAGWSVLPQMSFSFQDGTANGADMIVVNDTDVISLSNNAVRVLLMTKDCPGGTPINGGEGTATISVDSIDMDNDGTSDFRPSGSQYVIFDSVAPKTAMISTMAGNAITLNAASSANVKFVAPGIYYCVDDTTNPLCRPVGTTIQYVLRRSDRTSGGLQPIAENMADLQVAYKDNNDAACNMATQVLCNASPGCEWLNGGCTGYWYGRLNCAGQGSGAGNFCGRAPFEPEQISLIRLTVVTRSSNLVDGTRMNPSYCRPAVENHIAAAVGSADCGFLYRTYSALIQPRSNR